MMESTSNSPSISPNSSTWWGDEDWLSPFTQPEEEENIFSEKPRKLISLFFPEPHINRRMMVGNRRK